MTSLKRSRRAAAAVVASLLLVPAIGACSTTVARPSAPPSSSAFSPEPAEPTSSMWTDVDEELSDLITQIDQDRDDTAIVGYAGVAVDAEHRALDLWWVGTPPERIARLIAAPPHGLVIRLHAAAYDYATTDRAVGKLMNRYPAIHAASPESDGSGIEVETTKKGKRTLPDATRLAEQAGLPVRVVISAPPEPA